MGKARGHDTSVPGPGVPLGIDDKGMMSYLVPAYYSVVILVPDALGVLENVEIRCRGRPPARARHGAAPAGPPAR
jgi:encapsulin shell SprI-like protein